MGLQLLANWLHFDVEDKFGMLFLFCLHIEHPSPAEFGVTHRNQAMIALVEPVGNCDVAVSGYHADIALLQQPDEFIHIPACY